MGGAQISAVETVGSASEPERSLLRVLFCGSVDDGKSTLLGRMLYDCGAVADDTLEALQRNSKVNGNGSNRLDFSLLADSLTAEREQGITIDVAYRYFSTPRRKLIVADTPGHEQYTRNMVTGASTSDLAVILVDAGKGILNQTKRHAFLAHLLGIRQVVLAVNKMDLIGYDQARFEGISADFSAFAAALENLDISAVPVVAVGGDNIAARGGAEMAWYRGRTLVELLEDAEARAEPIDRPLRLPVQWVCRPHSGVRGYAGAIVSGRIAPGDAVTILPSGRSTTVDRVETPDHLGSAAGAGAAAMVTLRDHLDISRGDMICAACDPVEIADRLCAKIVWFGEEPMLRGRTYMLRLGPQTALAQIGSCKHKIDINDLSEIPSRMLTMNEIGVCELALDRRVAFEPYSISRDNGGFILIDRLSNATVGAGMIDFALRRSQNIHWQVVDVDKTARGRLKSHRPCCLWFTGLSGSGKSTLANAVEQRLHAIGIHTYLLDGDNVRHGLCRDLGFTEADRVENVRRVSEVARLMVDAGLVTLATFISPFRAERQSARELFEKGEFIEVFVDAPLEVCESRDPKGLYKRARKGLIRNFTGIDQAYERPLAPEITLETACGSIEAMANRLVDELRRRRIIGS